MALAKALAGKCEVRRWATPDWPYMGEDVKAYEAKYTMKAGDEKDWKALVELCRIIDQTPAEKLEQETRQGHGC